MTARTYDHGMNQTDRCEAVGMWSDVHDGVHSRGVR